MLFPLLAAAFGAVTSPAGELASAKHLDDFWKTSIYSDVVYMEGKYFLDLGNQADLQQSAPIRNDVPNNAGRLTKGHPKVEILLSGQEMGQATRLPGSTCLVDERDGSTKGAGIAHFTKRLMPFYSLLNRRSKSESEPIHCDRVVFPGTESLASDFKRGMVQIVVPNFQEIEKNFIFADQFSNRSAATPLSFEKLIVPHRRHTYFHWRSDATTFRHKAYMAAQIDGHRKGPTQLCYYHRDPSEGMKRAIINEQEVIDSLWRHAHQSKGTVEFKQVSCNSQMTWHDQVRTWTACDVVIAPHGSQNINLMFLRRASGFMELNPYMFYYNAFESLAQMAGVNYVALRDSTAVNPNNWQQVQTYLELTKAYAEKGVTDTKCQDIPQCRVAARKTPFTVNVHSVLAATSLLIEEFKRGSGRNTNSITCYFTPELPATQFATNRQAQLPVAAPHSWARQFMRPHQFFL